jgi:Ca-activated chloride channel homolog
VTDSKRHFVGGLTERDFVVLEDNVPQDVSLFAPGHVPLDLAILLDLSGSIGPNLPAAQDAAANLVKMVRPADRVMVVGFYDRTEILSPLSHDAQAAVEAIRGATAGGSTAFYNTLYTTISELVRSRNRLREMHRQAIVVLSDGLDNRSLVTYEDVMESAREAGIAIYTIGLTSPIGAKPPLGWPMPAGRDDPQTQFVLNALARETGGRPFFPTDARELKNVYAVIADELTNQYTLGYESTNVRRDGAFRRVTVRVVDRPEVIARTRVGYNAGRPAAASGR